jgi:hypothetical protein
MKAGVYKNKLFNLITIMVDSASTKGVALFLN